MVEREKKRRKLMLRPVYNNHRPASVKAGRMSFLQLSVSRVGLFQDGDVEFITVAVPSGGAGWRSAGQLAVNQILEIPLGRL
jgi:hypothetical protein